VKRARILRLTLALLVLGIAPASANAEPRQSATAVMAFSDELAMNPKTNHDFVNSTNKQCVTGIGCVQCPQNAETYSDPNNPVGTRYYQCNAEYAYKNVRHYESGIVTPRQIARDRAGKQPSGTVGFQRRWKRRWGPVVLHGCAPGIPGRLTSNGGCLFGDLQQYFEYGDQYHFHFVRTHTCSARDRATGPTSSSSTAPGAMGRTGARTTSGTVSRGDHRRRRFRLALISSQLWRPDSG
jgi:hypothetical protein